MGCSSSTQTHPQGGNRPAAKAAETNGTKKSASEGSDPVIDDVETIPDQTNLAENEPSEEQAEAVEAVEGDGTETSPPEPEESCAESPEESCAESPEEAPVDAIPDQDNAMAEGEIEDAVEAEMSEEIAGEGPETIENETGHPEGAAEPEINTENVEE